MGDKFYLYVDIRCEKKDQLYFPKLNIIYNNQTQDQFIFIIRKKLLFKRTIKILVC